MTKKDKLKNLFESKNPIAFIRRYTLRRKLKNKDITFLTPNCIGGILFHDLGLKFCSPTVNLMMTKTDFLQFVLHLDDYLDGQFEFFEHSEYNCPCAILSKDGLKSITVVFTHYPNDTEALNKWNERKTRINRDNIFVFIEERDGITKDDLKLLAELPVKGVVAFTCNEYSDIPYTVYIPKYHNCAEVGNILARNYLDGSREYEKYFDFVKWFNESHGKDFNVKEFII